MACEHGVVAGLCMPCYANSLNFEGQAIRRVAADVHDKEATERAFDRWAYQRLNDLVVRGRADLCDLRNRFGMSAQGKLLRASAITEKEREDAKYHIEKDEA